MFNTKKIKYKTLIGLHILIVLSFSLTMGCQTIKYESRLMKKQSQEQGAKFAISAAQLRLELNDLAGVFRGTIERAADEVIAQSANKDIARHALLWKINGIPTAYRALFHTDPAVALIDVWAFTMQMVNYFEEGPGNDDFNQWNQIALDASRTLEQYTKEHVKKVREGKKNTPLQVKIQAWAKNNPIERDFIYRESLVPVLGSMIGDEEIGAFQTVGSIGMTVEDIAYRFGVYMNLLTKQASWQAELITMGTEDKPGIQDGLIALNELGTFVNRIEPLLSDAPSLIAREREAILKAIQLERAEVLTNINQQRLDILKYLKDVHLAVIDELKNERHAVLDALISERKSVLQSIDQQRIATLSEIESVGKRLIDNGLNQSKPIIDYILVRVLLILAVLSLCGMVGGLILVWMIRKRTITTSVA